MAAILKGPILLSMGRELGYGCVASGAFIVAFSVVLIWKSTRDSLARGQAGEKYDR